MVTRRRRALARFDRTRNSKGGNKPGEIRPLMQEVMQSGFGVFRRGDTLKEGLDKLIALRDPLERVTVDDPSLKWNVALGLGARARQPGRAGRGDRSLRRMPAPNPEVLMRARTIKKRDDENWLKHTVAWKDADWNVTFAYRPVRLDTLSNEVESFPPAERTH